MAISIPALLQNKRHQQFELYDQFLNQQLLGVLKILGFDKKYTRAENKYLFD
jgi:ornithine--oxo-acid transaminase